MTTKAKEPKFFMAFRPKAEMAKAMQRLTERDGISTSEQIRRALEAFLLKKGTLAKESKRRTQ